ncbi:MAG TPA: L-2-amino-thiazoline-4-carboxylic acid hydrolase, partial [Methylomirabilota bacterium]|nr:L-2-amino-thiazoline-4-carboxylic acid hydrolase [Methylomirabilota bacterium]
MENPHATSLPLLDEVKLQARVLVSVIRALRDRIGKAAADQLVGVALRQWSRDLHRRIGEEKADGGRERWDAIWTDLRPRIGNAVESERLREDAGAREFNVTRCAYAEFFKGLGEPELGRFLACDLDFD